VLLLSFLPICLKHLVDELDSSNHAKEELSSESENDDDDDEVDSVRFFSKPNKKKENGSKFVGMMKFYLKNLVAETRLLETRSGRAGLVFNPLRGLKAEETFPLSPFTPTKAEDGAEKSSFLNLNNF